MTVAPKAHEPPDRALETQPTLVTEEEFLALPESLERLELLDGEVIVGPSPDFSHQDAAGLIYVKLWTWARNHPPALIAQAPLDLKVAPNRIVQPDLMLWLQRPPSMQTPIVYMPDVIIEVLSTNRVHDRIAKRALYAGAGVPEYWIVDRALRQVEIFTGAGLIMSRVEKELLRSKQVPELEIKLEELFATG